MKEAKRYGWMAWCALFLVLVVGPGACAPVPGGGGALPDGSLKFLPDPDGGSQTDQAADVPGSKDTPADTAAPDQAKNEPQTPDGTSTPEPTAEPTADSVEPIPELTPEPAPESSTPLASWIGGPCRVDSDCDYKDGACMTAADGYPEGSCSLSCTRLCPDKDGQPGTFCVDVKGKVPGGAGGCISRCDYEAFPGAGCRKGYHCAASTRYNEAQTQVVACIPGKAPTPSGTCYQKLSQEGVAFTPRSNPKASPSGYPNLLCDVIDAVSISPTIHGVTWVTGANKASNMFMRCSLALALSKFSKYLKARGIVKVMHYGTYNCRTIRNDSGSTSTLSQHGLGDAVDLAAFWDGSNKEYNLVKHWDHSTTWKKSGATGCHSTSFNSNEAKVLYEIACDMWKQKIFTLVLTPNFNKVHDNHFHVDLSGSGSVLSLPYHIGTHAGH